MIEFNYGWDVATYSWFGFNAVIVLNTLFLKFTFEVSYEAFSKTIKEVVAGNMPTSCYETNPG
jgi:hypothetical protein